MRVIANPGGTNEQFARREFSRAQLAIHADNLSVFDEIVAGRADVMITDQVEARLRARQHGLCAASVRTVWAPMQKAFMIVGNPALTSRIDAALGRALRRESYAGRMAAWMDSPWAESSLSESQQLAVLSDARLAVVIEVARWKWNRKAAIEDLPRERALLAALRAAAAGRGIPAARVDEFFSAQMDAAKKLQRDLSETGETVSPIRERRRSGSGFTARIDELNSRMLDTLDVGRSTVARRHLGRLSVEVLGREAADVALKPLTRTSGT